jgi:hypothetical protein
VTPYRTVPARGRLWRLVFAIVLGLALLSLPGAAWAAGLPSLPGPPPTAGTGFPATPAAGTMPVAGPVGPAVSLPAILPGAGLQGGFVLAQGRHLALAIACRSRGAVSLTASALGPGVLSRGGYACRHGQASAQLSLSPAAARRLKALRSTLAGVTLGGGGAEHFSVTLEATPTKPAYWTNGGIDCNFLGAYEPYLVSPNFTVTPPALISVRPWVAYYTPANGWRWLGTQGINSSSWYLWWATPGGVATWVTPTGALNPWTWAPIHVPAGHQIDALGVFEVIYWYAHPRYTWAYTSSTLGTYCTYP